jgi:hypothetical protein
MTKWWQVSKHTILEEDKLEEVCIHMHPQPKYTHPQHQSQDTKRSIDTFMMKAELDAQYC